MKKTLLIGNFGDNNLGDELILDSALEFYGADRSVVMTNDSNFSQQFCEKEFETINPFPTGFRSFFKFLFSKKYRKSIFDKQGNIEKIVFVGGGLFAIKTKAYFIWWIMSLWTKNLFKGQPVYWEYQGVDVPKNFLEKFFLKSALKNAKNISVRDQNSFEVLKKLGIESEIKEDRVFEELKSKKVEKLRKGKVFLLNAIKEIDEDSWIAVQELAVKEKLEVIFVAFTPKDKKTIPIDFAGKIVFPTTKNELMNLFDNAKIVVGERFHSLVLGQIFCEENTFLLRKPYSEKVKTFCEEYGIEIL